MIRNTEDILVPSEPYPRRNLLCIRMGRGEEDGVAQHGDVCKKDGDTRDSEKPSLKKCQPCSRQVQLVPGRITTLWAGGRKSRCLLWQPDDHPHSVLQSKDNVTGCPYLTRLVQGLINDRETL